MEYLEVLKASKIGNGLAAPDHYTRLFAQKIGAERSVDKIVDWSPIVHVTDALAKPVVDLKIKIKPVQAGKNNPSPTNIRPISGWTGANVVRCGKNLCFSKIANSSIGSSGTISESDSYDGYIARVKEGVTYKISDVQGVTSFRYGFFENVPVVGATSYDGSIRTITTIQSPIDGYIFIRDAKANGAVQIELGEIATTYAPYTGTTYPITFPSEAGTVYGGELDVTSGVIISKYAKVNLFTLNWTYIESYGVFVANILNKRSGNFNVKCDGYKLTSVTAVTSMRNLEIKGAIDSNAIFVKDENYTNATTFRQSLRDINVVYQLATPLTYQLTSTEVTTILGVNNIWADTGDSYLVYKAKKTKG